MLKPTPLMKEWEQRWAREREVDRAVRAAYAMFGESRIDMLKLDADEPSLTWPLAVVRSAWREQHAR